MPIPYGPKNVDALTNEFQRLKRQKYRQSGGVESRILLALAHYFGEQTVYYRSGTLILPGTTRGADSKGQAPPNLVFNMIRRNYKRTAGRFAATKLQFKGMPASTSGEDLQNADVFNMMTQAVAKEIGDEDLADDRLFWQYVGGVCAVHTTFMPNQGVEPVPVLDPATQTPLWEHRQTGEVITEQEMVMITTPPMDPMTGQPIMQPDPETGEPVPVPAQVPREAFKIHTQNDLTGKIVEEVISPLNLFVDHRCKGFDKLQPDECVIIAQLQSIDWVKNNFPNAEGLDQLRPAEEIRIVESTIEQVGDSLSGWALKDLIPGLTGVPSNEDPDSVVVCYRYQPPSVFLPKGWYAENYPEYEFDEDFDHGGRFTVFVPEQMIIRDGEIPYEDGVPLTDLHWERIRTTFWNQGACEDQLPAQQSYNRRRNQSIEATNTGQDRILLGPGLSKDDFNVDDPSAPIENAWNEDGRPLIGRLGAATWPNWATRVMEEDKELLFLLGGAADITQTPGYPGELRGNAWLPMAQELLDSEHGPFIKRYSAAMEQIITRRANRVKQFYPPEKIMRYTTVGGRDEVFTFKKSEVLRCDWNVHVVQSSMQPEFREMREAKMQERLQSGAADIIYRDPKTGVFDRTRFLADMLYDGAEAALERVAQHVKLQREEISLIEAGQQNVVAESMDDHVVHLEVLEELMCTTDFRYSVSEEFRSAIRAHAQQHADMLAQEQQAAAEAQQQQMMTGEMASLIAQAVNQSVTSALAQQGDVKAGIAREALTGAPEPMEAIGPQMPQMPGMGEEPM